MLQYIFQVNIMEFSNNNFNEDNNAQQQENVQFSQQNSQEVPQYQQNITYNQLQEQPKGYSIASFILGICSFCISCCVPYVSLLTSVLGIIFGALSVKRKQQGRGMAVAGIVLSGIGLAFSIVMCVLMTVALIEGVNLPSYYSNGGMF